MSQKTKEGAKQLFAKRVGGTAKPGSFGGKSNPTKIAASGTKKDLPHSHKSKHTDLLLMQSGSVLDSCPEGGTDGLSKNATVAKLERELAELKKENTVLKKELTEIRCQELPADNYNRGMHEQLIHESPEENFSEKRVNLLKSQIWQLERQVLLMTRALGTRGELLVDLFNMMEWLEEREKSLNSTGAEFLQRVSTLNLRLSNFMQAGVVEKLAQPVRFLDSYVKPKRAAGSGASGGYGQDRPTVTLVDVCRDGALDNINLKYVSHLESKLADLFGLLTQLKASLDTAPPRTGGLFQPIREHCCDHVTKCCKLIGECTHDLLCLSLLTPTVPWPPLKGSEVSLNFSVDDILKNVPTSVKYKKEIKESLKAAKVAFSYSTDMQENKCRSIESELQFHKAVYDLQAEYVDSLFKAIRSGYEEFESSLQELVCTPLETLLSNFDALALSGSEDSLRQFLSSFKQSYPELKDAVQRIRKAGENDSAFSGSKALSSFGQQFFEQLHKLEKSCGRHKVEENI